MASQNSPDPNNVQPIRRESGIKSLTKKARTLTIGSSHAAEEAPEEKGVKHAWCSAYRLNWEEKIRPFLEERYPELKAKYETKHLSDDKFWFVVPDHLTEDDVENLKAEIVKFRDKNPTDPQKEKRADSPEGGRE